MNILMKGLDTLGQRGINVCGDDEVHAILAEPELQVIVGEAEKRTYG